MKLWLRVSLLQVGEVIVTVSYQSSHARNGQHNMHVHNAFSAVVIVMVVGSGSAIAGSGSASASDSGANAGASASDNDANAGGSGSGNASVVVLVRYLRKDIKRTAH